jgi:CTP:molybdopterin cytidylyltransferase MocA
MSRDRLELHALVLAAGAASRFGALKQLAAVDGQPLLQRVLTRAGAAADRTRVVLGAHAARLAPLVTQCAAGVVINANWREGIASSIRAGVQHLPATCAGVMLVLGDQALIETEDFKRLALTWRAAPRSIVAARHGAVLGAPAIFPRRWFGALGQLSGDAGARALIERHSAAVIAVEMPNAAFDLDTSADLARLAPAADSGGAGPSG